MESENPTGWVGRGGGSRRHKSKPPDPATQHVGLRTSPADPTFDTPLTVDELRAWLGQVYRHRSVFDTWFRRLDRRHCKDAEAKVMYAYRAIDDLYRWIGQQPGVIPPAPSIWPTAEERAARDIASGYAGASPPVSTPERQQPPAETTTDAEEEDVLPVAPRPLNKSDLFGFTGGLPDA